jgi:hypothetical protein
MNVACAGVSIALVAASFSAPTALGQVSMAPAPVPTRPAIVRTQPAGAPPPARRALAQGKNDGRLTQDDLRQLAQIMQRMKPKERKQFTKAINKLGPETRKLVVEGMIRQLEGKETPPHQVTLRRELKAPQPLPPRLAY